jgi:hypothetical protein
MPGLGPILSSGPAHLHLRDLVMLPNVSQCLLCKMRPVEGLKEMTLAKWGAPTVTMDIHSSLVSRLTLWDHECSLLGLALPSCGALINFLG